MRMDGSKEPLSPPGEGIIKIGLMSATGITSKYFLAMPFEPCFVHRNLKYLSVGDYFGCKTCTLFLVIGLFSFREA